MKKILAMVLALALVLTMGLSAANAEAPVKKIIWWVYGEAPIDTKLVDRKSVV